MDNSMVNVNTDHKKVVLILFQAIYLVVKSKVKMSANVKNTSRELKDRVARKVAIIAIILEAVT